MDIYGKLIYKSENPIKTWTGNNRWYAAIDESKGSFDFCAAPVSREDGDSTKAGKILNKTFFRLVSSEPDAFIYYPDGVKNSRIQIDFPFGSYGAIINSYASAEIISENGKIKNRKTADGRQNVTVSDGVYTLSFVTDADVSVSGSKIIMSGKDGARFAVSVSFGTDEFSVTESADRLFSDRDVSADKSRKFWNGYFDSCPVYISGEEELLVRQYWAWWCLLVNVSDVEFNRFPVYMAPDRTGWLGTWSNDGPECMAALSLTCMRDTAKRLICSYIDAAINSEGRHGWYLHSDGESCYGRKGDSGRLSNGVAIIVHTVGFYIRNTGDKDILDFRLPSGMTVYEKLSLYMHSIGKDRDINSDSLIEWANLWESGWDDKLGCFFRNAPIGEWWKAAESMSEAEYQAFLKKNRSPVTTVVEQVYYLRALSEMSAMARIKNDAEFEKQCADKYNKVRAAVRSECWSGEDGFYHDIDVNAGEIINAKSADSFYFLYYETDGDRKKQIYSHLDNPDEFGLYYTPMQSADCEGFSPDGYWSGGHWPREMSYLALGLDKAGYTEKAVGILKKALCSGKGNIFYEVLNPYTGKPTTGITRMAYDIMDVVALLAVSGKIRWTREI